MLMIVKLLPSKWINHQLLMEKILLNFLDRKKTFINQVNKSFEVEVDFETQNQLEGKAVWLGMIKV
jgi:hypothetical protein